MKTKLLYTIAILLFGFTIYAQQVPVTYELLPAEAKAFLTEHFKSPFHHAIKEVKKRSITYDVYLNDNTEIEFSEAGKWKEIDGKGKAIPTAFIQKQILDYININYPGQAITGFEVHATGYEAELGNGLDLKFDMQGIFTKLD